MNQHNSSETFIAPAINLASEMFAAVSDVRRDDVFVLIVASEPDDSTCRNYNYLGEQGNLFGFEEEDFLCV